MKISQLIENKKGMMDGLGALPKVAIVFVVVGIVFGIGFTILNTQNATYTANSYAANATRDTQAGMAQITGYLPTIGLVVAAVVVIGLVVGLLYKQA